MRRSLFLVMFVCAYSQLLTAQIKWKDDSVSFADIGWNNYSTTYMGEDSDSIPLLVTAIPYNGIYDMGGSSLVDLTFKGSAFRFRSNLADNHRELVTFDSSAVYFLAPGIFRSNAAGYEYRVLQDSQTIIKPWTTVTQFSNPDFQINNFKKGFAFLGGYSAPWGHVVVVELRSIGQSAILSAATVYWQQTRPTLTKVLTSAELNEYYLTKKRSFGDNMPGSSIGSPDIKKVLAPGETSLILYCSAEIYKRTALEYRLQRDGHIERDWSPNEYDNNTIWLRGLGPGHYTIGLRYAKQRHNTTEYSFEIQPAWYQTWTVRILAFILLLAACASLVLLVKLRRQRRRTAAEKGRKERHALELASIHAQLNPHFIFNALSSIQGLINKNDIVAANRYLSDFGALVRSYLTDSHKEMIPLQRELKTLDTYLALEQLRFDFTYAIECATDIPTPEVEIPSLLLQPLVENAVKHGMAGIQQARGTGVSQTRATGVSQNRPTGFPQTGSAASPQEHGIIGVTFHRQDRDLHVIVHDNGPGFDPTAQSPGFGLKLTRDRIGLLNEMAGETLIEWSVKSGVTVDAIPGATGGARIEIIFKNWLA